MAPPMVIARQLSHPRGWFGHVVGALMNRHNARMNRFAVESLNIEAPDTVLEIGFGGGATIRPFLDKASSVTGVDRSATMVARARRKFHRDVKSGRARFLTGNVEKLPFADVSFSKVCTVNTIYFWPSLAAGFAEIRRVLRPGGVLAVGFLPEEPMRRLGFPTSIFKMQSSDGVAATLCDLGFSDVRVQRPDPSVAWNVVIASCGGG